VPTCQVLSRPGFPSLSHFVSAARDAAPLLPSFTAGCSHRTSCRAAVRSSAPEYKEQLDNLVHYTRPPTPPHPSPTTFRHSAPPSPPLPPHFLQAFFVVDDASPIAAANPDRRASESSCGPPEGRPARGRWASNPACWRGARRASWACWGR
jgi:hypothetical protein